MSMDPIEAEIVREQPKASRLGFDSVLEDLFGLNIRAVKSIGTLFRAPSRYTDAARSRDWLNRFTPSFRIWLGLYALLAGMRFIYGGENSPMVDSLVAQLEADSAFDDLEGLTLDYRQFAVDLYRWMFVLLPFIFIPTYAVVAFLFRSFPGQPGFVLRLRYVFSTVIPSTSIIVAMTPILLLPLSGMQMMLVSSLSFLTIIGLDYVTAYRGALSKMGKSRAGVSFGLTVLLLIAYLFATIAATIPAMIISLISNLSRSVGG